MHWEPPVFHWYYNPKNAPDWLEPSEALELVQRAVTAWQACGPALIFEGETQREAGVMEGVNVLGWRTALGRSQRGVTLGRSRPNGVILERDVVISAQREEFRRSPRLLEKVVLHEVGHALGLYHAPNCTEVMSTGAGCPGLDPNTLPLLPTPGDLAACASRYGPTSPH